MSIKDVGIITTVYVKTDLPLSLCIPQESTTQNDYWILDSSTAF